MEDGGREAQLGDTSRDWVSLISLLPSMVFFFGKECTGLMGN